MVDDRGGIGLKKYSESRVVVSAKNADRVLSIVIPRECSSCGFGNFYIWSTVLGGRLRVEVRCMRCGKGNGSLDRVIGASSRSYG
jgi:hypothetical protein